MRIIFVFYYFEFFLIFIPSMRWMHNSGFTDLVDGVVREMHALGVRVGPIGRGVVLGAHADETLAKRCGWVHPAGF